MAKKLTKKAVNYRRGTPLDHCSLCMMFRKPDRCTLVQGDIRPPDLCNRYAPKRKR